MSKRSNRRYTDSQLQILRDHGVLPPSKISRLAAGDTLSPSDTDYINLTIGGVGEIIGAPRGKSPLAGTRRSRSQGYKYFPDNP